MIRQLTFPYLACLIAALLVTLWTFDRLLKLEYETYYAEWVQDGRPDGIFSHFSGSSWFKGSFARNWLSFRWLFVTPEWMKSSPQAMKLIIRLRISASIWNLGILVALVVTFAFPSAW